jgi:hypothetical protein
MNDLAQFSALAALIIGGFSLFAWMFQRLETRLDGRIDRLDGRIDGLGADIAALRREHIEETAQLRRDLAEEFRAQRAEAAAQVAAIANAIIASRGDGR